MEQVGQKKYSALQIAILTGFFGPLVATYMIKKNFDTLGDHEKAGNALRYGLLVCALLCMVIPFLPDNFPHTVLPISFAISAQMFFKSYQEKAMEGFATESTLKAIGLSLLCGIALFAASFITFMLFDGLGLINLDSATPAPTDAPTDAQT